MPLTEPSPRGTRCDRTRKDSPSCGQCDYFLPSFALGCWACWHDANKYGQPERIEMCEQLCGYCEGFSYRTVRVDNG